MHTFWPSCNPAVASGNVRQYYGIYHVISKMQSERNFHNVKWYKTVGREILLFQ
jgi:hypothetical protein